MPSRQGLRPLKAWRYVGVFGPELMLCLATVRIGPARQCFWAIWDRRDRRGYEQTELGSGVVTLAAGRAQVLDRDTEVAIELDESPGVETVCEAAPVASAPFGSKASRTRRRRCGSPLT